MKKGKLLFQWLYKNPLSFILKIGPLPTRSTTLRHRHRAPSVCQLSQNATREPLSEQ